MELHKLPNEMVLSIAGQLGCTGINSLLRTCKRFYDLLDPFLYKRAVANIMPGAFLWACSTDDSGPCPHRLRAASKCITAGVDVDMVYPYDDDDGTGWPGEYTEYVRWATPLCLAAGAGNTLLARLLLNAGADINLAGSAGFPPIIIAILGEDNAMVGLLLDNKTKLQIKGPGNLGPLALATRFGSAAGKVIFERLLAAVEDHDDVDYSHADAFFEAIVNENVDALRSLIKQENADPNKIAADAEGATCLATACALGNLEMVKLLCEESAASVNYAVEGADPPFATATMHKQWDVVLYLLKLGRVRLCDWNRWFEYVCDEGPEQVAVEMIQRVDMTKEQAMIWTCIAQDTGREDLVKRIQIKLEEWDICT